MECHSSFHWLQQKQKYPQNIKLSNFPRLSIILGVEMNQMSGSHLHKVSDSLSQWQWVTPCTFTFDFSSTGFTSALTKSQFLDILLFLLSSCFPEHPSIISCLTPATSFLSKLTKIKFPQKSVFPSPSSTGFLYKGFWKIKMLQQHSFPIYQPTQHCPISWDTRLKAKLMCQVLLSQMHGAYAMKRMLYRGKKTPLKHENKHQLSFFSPTIYSFHATTRKNEKIKHSHPFKIGPFLNFWLIPCSLPLTQSYSNESAIAFYALNAWEKKKTLIRTKSFLHCIGCHGKLDQSKAVSTEAGVNFLCGNSSGQKASLIHSQYWEWVNSDERMCTLTM